MNSVMPEPTGGAAFVPFGSGPSATTQLLGLYATADILLGLSYCLAALALLQLLRKRPDLELNGLAVLFAAALFASGLSHWAALWTLWQATFWLDIAIRSVAAVLAVITVATGWPLLPKLARVPGPRQLRDTLQRLKAENRQRRHAEITLAALNASLEARVAARTAELVAANQDLQAEIALHKTAEDGLRISELRFRSLIRTCTDIVWRTDAGGMRLVAENGLKQFSGNDTCSNDLPFSALHDDDRTRFDAEWRQAVGAPLETFQGEYRMRRHDGQWRQMRISAVALRDDDGLLREWVGTCVDITDLRHAHSEALRLDQRLSQFIGVLQGLAGSRDLQSLADTVTRGCRALTHADGAALILREGAEHVRYIATDAIEPLWQGQRFELDECIGGRVIREKIPAIVPDLASDLHTDTARYKASFVKSLVAVPIGTADPAGAIGCYWQQPHRADDDELNILRVLGDTTAIALNNLRHYEELERRVAERTAQLQTLNKELETFTYSVSHDLKAPLRGIDGFSRLLLEDYADKLDEDGRSFLGHIRQGTQQMGQLIQDLLEYSRMERRELHPMTIDLRHLVTRVVAGFHDEIRRREAEVRIAVGDFTVQIDADGLTLALRNLLDNALKFSRATPKPEIEIGAQTQGDRLQIWVKDNGIGIERKYQDKIFEIFQRLHRPEDYPGTGIGLAIVRKALQRIGGQVQVQSEPDHGSTFLMDIPQ